jgi:hypothetical protein
MELGGKLLNSLRIETPQFLERPLYLLYLLYPLKKRSMENKAERLQQQIPRDR